MSTSKDRVNGVGDAAGERKFTRGLSKPGSAAAVRETVSQAVRKGTSMSKPKRVDPVDYEQFLAKNRGVLDHDLLKDMIFIPEDAFEINVQPRMRRTVDCPTRALLNASDEEDEEGRRKLRCSETSSAESPPHLLVESSVASFVADWTTVDYKADDYGGSFAQLPKRSEAGASSSSTAIDHVFEVDAELTEESSSNGGGGSSSLDSSRSGDGSGSAEIIKKGYLQKGPETRGDASSSMISISFHPKSFKRRFFYLKQQVDMTYILEYHRDEKHRGEAKGAIYLDSCVEVVKAQQQQQQQSQRRSGKLVSFDVVMQDKSRFSLAAESEPEADLWITVLRQVLAKQESSHQRHPPDKLNLDSSSNNRDSTISMTSVSSSAGGGSLHLRESLSESLSKHPELLNYARENDRAIADSRKRDRRNIFSFYSEMKESPPVEEEIELEAEMLEEFVGYRFAVEPTDLRLRLRADATTTSSTTCGDGTTNPEPFFVSMALFDARRGIKLTENFHFEPNHPDVRRMIPKDVHRFNGPTVGCPTPGKASMRNHSTSSSSSSTMAPPSTAPPSTASSRRMQEVKDPRASLSIGASKTPSLSSLEGGEEFDEPPRDYDGVDENDAASTVSRKQQPSRQQTRPPSIKDDEISIGAGSMFGGAGSMFGGAVRYAPRLVEPLLRHLIANAASSPKKESLESSMTWVQEPKQAVFNISQPHPDIFLVVRVEKVLQGALSKCLEPYQKSDSVKAGNKVRRQMKEMCCRIGNYRMPFAWSIFSVFEPSASPHVPSASDKDVVQLPLFRQDTSKLSDEALLKFLADLREKPEKMPEKLSKLAVIPGEMTIAIRHFKQQEHQQQLRCLDPSLVPLAPFPPPQKEESSSSSSSSTSLPSLSLETQEFSCSSSFLNFVTPFSSYQNHIYVYPRELKYDVQKAFPRARNITVTCQVRDSDEPGALPLRCIYGRPGPAFDHSSSPAYCAFVTSASTNVLHHDDTPEFYDEIKIRLPANLHHKHHLLFTFYHVSCEGQKKTMSLKRADSVVGQAWLPLLNPGRLGGVVRGQHQLQVAVKLPEGGGYLAQTRHQQQKQQQAVLAAKMPQHPPSTALSRKGSGHGGQIYAVNGPNVNGASGGRTGASQNTPPALTHSQSALPLSNGNAPSAAEAGDGSNNNVTANNNPDMKGVFYSFTEAFDKPEKLNSTPINWVEAKPLFRVSVTWASTVYSTDPHLHAFFEHCGSDHCGDHSTSDFIKALHAVDVATLVRFLFPLLDRLFQLLCRTALPEDVALNILRLFVHILSKLEGAGVGGKMNFARSYVKFCFDASKIPGSRTSGTQNHFHSLKTVHEEMMRHLPNFLLRDATADNTLFASFLKHLWFFYRICLKSMAQFLQRTGRSRDAHRDIRFSKDFHENVASLIASLTPRLRIHGVKSKVAEEEGRQANKSTAQFLKRAFSLMDRGFVFRVINDFVDEFEPGDNKILFRYKLDLLRIVCSHEHYVPLNLPVMRRGFMRNFPELQQEFSLTDKFCRTHFLVGLVLRELRGALREVREVRVMAVRLLRDLLAKHSYDDRYAPAGQRARVASLYLPLIQVILENKPRLTGRDEDATVTPGGTASWNGAGNRNSTAPTLMTLSPDDTLNGKRASFYGEGFDIGSLGPPPPVPRDTSGILTTPGRKGGASSFGMDSPMASTPATPKPFVKSASARESSVLALIAGGTGPGNNSNHPLLAERKGFGGSSTSINSSESFPSVSDGPTSPRQDSGSFDHLVPSPLTSPVTDSGVSVNSEGRPPVGPFANRRGIRGSGANPPTTPHHLHPNEEDEDNDKTVVVRFDKLDGTEVKDLLVCFLHVVKEVEDEALVGWWDQATEFQILDFFGLLEICLYQFRYRGRKRILLAAAADSSPSHHSLHSDDSSASPSKSATLPARAPNPLAPSSDAQRHAYYASGVFGHPKGSSDQLPKGFVPTKTDLEAAHRVTLEANLATEVGIIVLDVIGVYMNKFKEKLEDNGGDNTKMRKLFDIFVSLLHSPLQSETVVKHTFASLRAFIRKFPALLFRGNSLFCGTLCYEILRCCNSRLASTRSEACGLLYLLMRSNFEFSQRKGFTRVHLQVIVAVSQLISDVVGLSGNRFQESLSIVNSFANSDRQMQVTSFPSEVKDLTKRIRTILMATSQMKDHQNDPEMLVDLQYSLAKSYASTPELRKTWLESIAKIHIKQGNFSEAAHCSIHIAALVAEYLKRRGETAFESGCQAFSAISPNIEPEETGIKTDASSDNNGGPGGDAAASSSSASLEGAGATFLEQLSNSYTEWTVAEHLETARKFLVKGDRFEALVPLSRLVIPIYEKNRDFRRLTSVYEALYLACQNAVKVSQNGRRYLGKYFRVAFYGQPFFEEEDGKEYIYKEPKVTSLTEVSNRLWKLYAEKLGQDNVRLIMDSKQVDPGELDPKRAHLQVTFVEPHFDAAELATERLTYFEKNHNLRRFVFETPFTKDEAGGGKARASKVEDQWLRQTILTTDHCFPYVKKRILVAYRRVVELEPIRVAIIELKRQRDGLTELTSRDPPDLVQLQLRLQGSVAPQVNAGALAFVSAFLAPDRAANCDPASVEELDEAFEGFLSACSVALDVHRKRVTETQEEYHASLVQRFAQMRVAADEILEGDGGGGGGGGQVANLAPVAVEDCVDQMLGPDSTA